MMEDYDMTCVAGLRKGNNIYLACDSETTWGMNKHNGGSKIFRKGEALFAFSGLCAVPHALEHRLAVPEVPENDEIKWINVYLLDAIRKTLKEVNLYQDKSSEDSCMNAVAIVGWRSHLFTLDPVLSVMPCLNNYIALGSGGDVAMGALYATEGQGAEKRLTTAVQAAQEWSVGVGGDVYVEKV